VGNKAAVFPLQLLGFDVDFVNSVHFSNHTGYEHGLKGDVMNGEQLKSILKGLEDNGLLGDVGYVLTGYIGSATFCEAILTVLLTIRQYNPQVIFVCDPVLGDHGKFYVPKELVQVYIDTVIPLADVVTPNQFEVEQLTGITIATLQDARNACDKLHAMGPSLVFITSMVLVVVGEEPSPDEKKMSILASKRVKGKDDEVWQIDCPMIPGSFTGTGDLTASLLLAHLAKVPDNLPVVMEKVINTMYAVIQRTHTLAGTSAKSRELKLIQSKQDIENPPSVYKAKQSY
jgi:pyridoxine kinase